jgi:hypothetical protein
MKTVLLLGMAALFLTALAAPPQATETLAPSAQIDKPASPSKLLLIRRFLRAIGLQQQLDTGSFLERYAIPGGPMWQVSSAQPVQESLRDGYDERMSALKTAYAKHRAEYQQEYEEHVNWEFTEAELAEIVGLLERPVGKHFLDGRWRMDAYVGTNTEALEEQIVREAMASVAGDKPPLEWKDLPAICRSFPPENSDHYDTWIKAREYTDCECQIARTKAATRP